ncbi:hypothetical protein [Streptomyces sp. NPDC002082]|uniref:hypothetical protein n=1 Tax=Streptomyces sp. NPDC002082 TaxID=3154772 RepID=UPI003323EAA3
MQPASGLSPTPERCWPPASALGGQLVVRDTAASRLSFEALQRRAAARGRTAAALAVKTGLLRHTTPPRFTWP